MECSLKIELSVKKVTDAHARNTMLALAGSLASTVIIFGALGAIQNQCRGEDPGLLIGVNGFSGAAVTCKKLYRYYWFITSLNFVVGVFGLWNTARGFLQSTRGAIIGLLVIANLLTINMTDAFLTMQSVPKWQSGVGRDRDRTMIAGCIITAVFQAFAIILAGLDHTASPESSLPKEPKAPKVKKSKGAKEAEPAVEMSPAETPAPAAETAAPATEAASPAAADPEAPPPAPADVAAPTHEEAPGPAVVEVAVDPAEPAKP